MRAYRYLFSLALLATLPTGCSAASPQENEFYDVEQKINEGMGSGLVTEEFNKNFPDRYKDMINSYIKNNQIYDSEGYTVVHKLFFRDSMQFITSMHGNIAKAPDENLANFARKRVFAIASMNVAPGLCSAFVTGHVRKSDPAYNQAADSNTLRASGDLIVEGLRAARAGIDHPQIRANQVEEQVKSAFLSELKRLSERSYELALHPELAKAATASDQCVLAIATAKAVADLPARESAQLMSYTLTNP